MAHLVRTPIAAGAPSSASAWHSGLSAPPFDASHFAGLKSIDRLQFEDVLGACQASASLSAAGRILFERAGSRKAMRWWTAVKHGEALSVVAASLTALRQRQNR